MTDGVDKLIAPRTPWIVSDIRTRNENEVITSTEAELLAAWDAFGRALVAAEARAEKWQATALAAEEANLESKRVRAIAEAALAIGGDAIYERWQTAEANRDQWHSAANEATERADAAEAREKQLRLEVVQGVLDLIGQAHRPPDEVPTDAITMHVGGQGHGWLIAVDQIGTAPLSAEEILARIDAREAIAAGGENPE